MATPANNLTTAEAITLTPNTILHVNLSSVTKLTNTSYLMWSLQVKAILDGYDLSGHLDGSRPAPSPTLTVNNVASENPAFARWRRQDKLIYGALIGAISPTIQPMVSRTTTAQEIWEKMAATYAKPSRGHIKQLKEQVKVLTKGTKSIDEYLQAITAKFDQLALLGKPFDHEDQVELILEGLPYDYKPVIDHIAAKDTTPTLTDVHERLLNHESKLLAAAVTASSVVPASANIAQQRNQYNNSSRGNYNNNRRTNNNNYGSTTPYQSQQPQPHQENRTYKPYLGKCQLCHTQGHSVKRCPQFQAMMSPMSSTQTSPFRPWQPRANVAAVGSPYNATNWLLDSGATHHITSDLNNLALHQPYHGSDDVLIADGSSRAISHTGFKLLPSQTRDLHLTNVLCVPDIDKNLISVYRLCNANKVSVEFFPASFQVKDLKTGVPLHQGKTRNELYEWPVSLSQATALTSYSGPKPSITSWHSRLGHPSFSVLNSVISTFTLPVSSATPKHLSCSECLLNKSHKLPFSNTSITSTRPLEYIYTDVWSSPIISIDNFKYYLILVDHYSRYTWFYPLRQKSQVKEVFVAFKTLVENKFQQKIGTLFSDNGGEFIALRSFLTTHGIQHLTSPPHTPEHNGLSERKHRHIVETGLTLLSTASIPKEYWTYAFATAVYLINRLPTPVLVMQSPFQKLFRTTPNYEKLRVFGCLCFPWLRPYNHNKLDDRSSRCVFLGYSPTQSAYFCLHVPSGRIYTTRHVQFDETMFPFANTPKSVSEEESDHLPTFENPITPIQVQTPPSMGPPTESLHSPPLVQSPPTSASQSSPPTTTQVLPSSSNSHDSSSPSEPTAHSENGPNSQAQSPSHTYEPTAHTHNGLQPSTQALNTSATHTTTHPNQLQQPIIPENPIIEPPQNTHKMQTRAKNNISKPKQPFSLTVTAKTKPQEPRTVNQALKDENWRRAMSNEFDAQTANHSWDLEPPNSTQNIVSCRWIFTIKELPNGEIERYKARLVARGFTQQYGVDYSETFSPVIKSTTIRVVLEVAVTKSWSIKQLDVNNAFLQGELTETVYMTQPPGFIDKDRPDYVCRLRKPIYGLKQAPRSWYLSLKQHLLQSGFSNSLADASLFVHSTGSTITYVLVYVDDIIVTGNNTTFVSQVLQTFAERFSIKDPVDLHYFLGIEAQRTPSGLHLMQRKYIRDLLARNNMSDAKPTSTPLPATSRLTLYDGNQLDDATQYRSVVGSLQYLAFTRPDISYAVNRLSQYMHRPTIEHWQAAKHVLRYLAGTADHGIFLHKNTPMTLHAFSDSDWAGDKDDMISTNAYVVYLGQNPISWSSKKQRGVARSSTEAEYRSVANTASEVTWICSLLTELGIHLNAKPVIYCDNIGATYLCANPVFHSRMKHIALDYHFIRNLIQAGVLRVSHVSTHDQLADALTKPLSRTKFQNACSKIGVPRVPPS